MQYENIKKDMGTVLLSETEKDMGKDMGTVLASAGDRGTVLASAGDRGTVLASTEKTKRRFHRQRKIKGRF